MTTRKDQSTELRASNVRYDSDVFLAFRFLFHCRPRFWSFVFLCSDPSHVPILKFFFCSVMSLRFRSEVVLMSYREKELRFRLNCIVIVISGDFSEALLLVVKFQLITVRFCVVVVVFVAQVIDYMSCIVGEIIMQMEIAFELEILSHSLSAFFSSSSSSSYFLILHLLFESLEGDILILHWKLGIHAYFLFKFYIR